MRFSLYAVRKRGEENRRLEEVRCRGRRSLLQQMDIFLAFQFLSPYVKVKETVSNLVENVIVDDDSEDDITESEVFEKNTSARTPKPKSSRQTSPSDNVLIQCKI